MKSYQFEIGLYPGRWDDYVLTIKYSHPNSDDYISHTESSVSIDLELLKENESDDSKYGQILSDTIFGADRIRDAYLTACRAADADGEPLRVRVSLGLISSQLNTIRWELLVDPSSKSRLALDQKILLSRHINDSDWRQVPLRSKTDFSALVVISNPRDLDKYRLAKINVPEEVARAQSALGGINVTIVGDDEYATPSAVFSELRRGFDILYLICHGAFLKERPRLWLQDDDGNSKVISGADIVQQCKELRILPRLAILASCHSAPDTNARREEAFSHLAPRLAEAGIPSIIGMQGPISIESAQTFTSELFTAFQHTHLVDEAVRTARNSIRHRHDWWVPSLIMRLNSGRLWRTSGFAGSRSADGSGSDRPIWQALKANINNWECTPIIGPELMAGFLGSRRELANRWADTYHFPMASRDRENLPQVAQYLSVEFQKRFPRDELLRYALKEASRRYPEFAGVNMSEEEIRDMAVVDIAEMLHMLMTDEGRKLREADKSEPHNVLSKLKVKTYVTTNYGNMLEEALRDAGRDPVVEICPWNKHVKMQPSITETEPKYRPTFERPLVFKVFGQLSDPKSVVLTEDDYFDFLIGATQNKNLIPRAVRGALCNTALLFVGYELDDWDFRVLFRTIISQEGWGTNEDVRHVAATLDPEEGRIIEPERARAYLERYFTSAQVDIFWGGSDEFLRGLFDQI